MNSIVVTVEKKRQQRKLEDTYFEEGVRAVRARRRSCTIWAREMEEGRESKGNWVREQEQGRERMAKLRVSIGAEWGQRVEREEERRWKEEQGDEMSFAQS